MLDDLKLKLNTLQAEYASKLGQKELLEKQLKDVEEELNAKKEYIELWQKTNILLQKTSEYQRKQACKQIEDIGTSALQFIMGSNFRLEVEMKEMRKKPEVEIYVVTEENGQIIRNKPQDSRGGGIVDIVSIALRIAIIMALDPPIDGPIILDEPGKHVSIEYAPLLSEFLHTISRQFGRQIIIVTHSDHIAQAADNKIRMQLEQGCTKIV